MNLAIFEKGTDRLTFFLRDAVKISSKEYRGAGGGKIVFKPHLYDVVHTLDAPPKGWQKGEKASLKPAPTFCGEPVGCDADVNRVTTGRIRERYSVDDELKLHRLHATGSGEEDWQSYVDFVAAVVSEGKARKEALNNGDEVHSL